MSDTSLQLIKREEDLADLLGGLGLSQVEVKVYLVLIGGQSQSVLILSRILGLARTTVYDSLAHLLDLGLVERIVQYKSHEYRVADVGMLDALVEKERVRVEQIASVAAKVKALIQLPAQQVSSTEVRHYTGASGIQQMIWNSLKAKDELVGYSVFGRVDVVGQKFTKRYTDAFSAKGLIDRVISNPTKRTLDYVKRDVRPGFHQMSYQNIRVLLESKLYVAGDTMLYNNIYAVSYWMEGEVVGVEIENNEFVKSQKSIFELLWNQAESVERYIISP